MAGSRTAVEDVAASRPGTVSRTLALVQLLAGTDDSVAVHEVAEKLGLPPSSTHRLLQQFLAEGFAVADPLTRRYRRGPAFRRVVALVQKRSSLAQVVQPYLEELTQVCDEATLFAVYDRTTVSVVFVAKTESSHQLSYRIDLNTPVSAYWGSSSQVILAYLPEAEQRRVVAAAGPSPVGAREPLQEDELAARLARIRAKGYAVTKGQKLPGAVGTAAPVFDSNGIVGSLTVTIPEVRFSRSIGPQIERLVVGTAKRISADLGYTK